MEHYTLGREWDSNVIKGNTQLRSRRMLRKAETTDAIKRRQKKTSILEFTFKQKCQMLKGLKLKKQN